MNIEIVQICDITLAVKFALKTKANIKYFPFEYERNIEFLFSKNKIDFLEKNYKAGNIEEWFDYCLNLGLEDIKLSMPIAVKDPSLLAFSNTSQAGLVCYFKDNVVTYFIPKWESGDNGWNVIYREYKWDNSPKEKPQFEDNTEDFKNTLSRIATLADKIDFQNFANIFNYAFELLDEKKYTMNKEKFPLNFLPDKNARLYVSSMTANVFGGMSSWNDGVPYCAYEKGLTDEYDKLSKELSEQMELATMYALNEW